MSAFYITTAIEYANGEPHLGHAFEKIGADAIARYRRLRGDTVHLLVGTDDHGLKVARAAQAADRTPGEQAERISAAFRRTIGSGTPGPVTKRLVEAFHRHTRELA